MSITLAQVIVSGLLLGAVYALFSSGLTLIWGMMNVVNFAHGDFVMLGMYAAVMVWTALGGGPFAAVPVAAMLIATLGVLSYFLLVRHIMRGPMLAQILGTFGLALFLRYAAFWTFGADFKTLPDTLVDNGFCNWDGHCLIQQPDLGYELECQATGSDYYLLYCPPGLGFFCIEPVSHPVNAHHLPSRPGLRLLEQGQSAELTFTLHYRPL